MVSLYNLCQDDVSKGGGRAEIGGDSGHDKPRHRGVWANVGDHDSHGKEYVNNFLLVEDCFVCVG